ncbi:unnamed protein product [Paramecium pentaurelia]|uniref:Uncharacterized protein n=1 Tax=Paramecium pentaurelia TaxID=43138 RepID=A0A8S1UKG8_9CILI|nr:unnamed protein product [Paramecium pentaurelia]
MILILSLFRIVLCDIRIVHDQTRQPYIFQWDSTYIGSGVVSQYCPLGINKYLYEQSNEDYYYFLQSGYFGDKQELLYLIYMEIQFEQRLIKVDGQKEVEGIIISTIINYSESGLVLLEQLWGDNNRRSYSFPYTQYPNYQVTQISGGIYSDINPITKNKIILKQFSGKMNAAILIKDDIQYLWNGFPYYQEGKYRFVRKSFKLILYYFYLNSKGLQCILLGKSIINI